MGPMDPAMAAVQRRLQGYCDGISDDSYEGQPPRTGNLRILRGLEAVLRLMELPMGEGGGGKF